MDEGASRGGADWGEMGDKDDEEEFIEALSLVAIDLIGVGCAAPKAAHPIVD